MEKKYVSLDAVSERYSLPKSWFYERTRVGQIPHRKFGKYLRFRIDELDEWFDRNCSLKLESVNKRRS
jgi:predicted DNA-binding transcriptional regulator AlpA